MSKLRRKDAYRPKESLETGLQISLRNNRNSSGLSSSLSKETLSSLEELGNTLKRIHRRMVSEGYQIKDGNVQKNTS